MTFAKNVNDGLRISNYGKEFDAKVPTIALAMGEFGKVSRVFNMRLTPVTHELMPFSAAPGQMTVKDIIESRIRLGVISPKQFFLFGSPIQLSPSPAMHNCGFKALCLPHHYDLHETMDPEAIAKVISSPTFGGASVTIPLKTKIFSLVDDVSDSAAAIGSINTLIKHQDGNISGDNTDWLAIYRLLERELRIRGYSVNDSLSTTSFSALVVGAGGTARSAVYALRKLNPKKIFVYNRSLSNAEKLVHDLGGQVLECLDDTLNVNVVVNTFPASIGWTAPPELLRRYQPLVFDVNYLPAKTELLRQAESFGCVTLRGISMLLEQGYAAFELWTGRHAPRAQMSKETMEFYNRISDDQN